MILKVPAATSCLWKSVFAGRGMGTGFGPATRGWGKSHFRK